MDFQNMMGMEGILRSEGILGATVVIYLFIY